MRGPFIRTLAQLAGEDDRIMLLTGDLGFNVVEPFAERFPDRFFNVGVAEQNMVGVATGLAEAGYFPFVYSIATFATLRAYEFIRNGPMLQHLPVRIVGVGGGFEYGVAGHTHHALEDIGVMRMQPGMTVVVPADHEQAISALRATWDTSGPVYYRLGKDERSCVEGLRGRFDIGRAQVVREGDDLLLVTMGPVALEAIAAADHLAELGIHCGVMVVASVSPAPTADLAQALAGTRLVLTAEAHYTTGGLGSLVSEVVGELGLGSQVVRIGVRGSPASEVGGERYLSKAHGLLCEDLITSALAALGRDTQ